MVQRDPSTLESLPDEKVRLDPERLHRSSVVIVEHLREATSKLAQPRYPPLVAFICVLLSQRITSSVHRGCLGCGPTSVSTVRPQCLASIATRLKRSRSLPSAYCPTKASEEQKVR